MVASSTLVATAVVLHWGCIGCALLSNNDGKSDALVVCLLQHTAQTFSIMLAKEMVNPEFVKVMPCWRQRTE